MIKFSGLVVSAGYLIKFWVIYVQSTSGVIKVRRFFCCTTKKYVTFTYSSKHQKVFSYLFIYVKYT